MGSAYGKGFVKAILKAAKRRGIKGIPISLVADFDPFQAAGLDAESNVFTQEFINRGSILSGSPSTGAFFEPTAGSANQSQNGADSNTGTGSSHSVSAFRSSVSHLKEGTYTWNGKKWVLQNDKK
jgi:hypothetical protein